MISTPLTDTGGLFRIVVFTLLCTLCSIPATAQKPDRGFIPHTLVTEQDLDEYKAELVRGHGVKESAAEEFIRDMSNEQYKYTDEDFRKAFPQLLPGDKQASLCSNSLMSGATRLVYLSPPSENTVGVKSSTCNPVQGGLSCSPLSEHQSYFFESPENHFTLDDREWLGVNRGGH